MCWTPCARIHHSSTSATALKLFGTERSPNGSIGSTYSIPSHSTACRGRSKGCTGTRRYADSISILARRAPGRNEAATAATCSTLEYMSEHRLESIPSLTLSPGGYDKSVISRHFPELWPLGFTPNRLTCNGGSCGMRAGGKGPSIRPSAHSLVR